MANYIIDLFNEVKKKADLDVDLKFFKNFKDNLEGHRKDVVSKRKMLGSFNKFKSWAGRFVTDLEAAEDAVDDFYKADEENLGEQLKTTREVLTHVWEDIVKYQGKWQTSTGCLNPIAYKEISNSFNSTAPMIAKFKSMLGKLQEYLESNAQ